MIRNGRLIMTTTTTATISFNNYEEGTAAQHTVVGPPYWKAKIWPRSHPKPTPFLCVRCKDIDPIWKMNFLLDKMEILRRVLTGMEGLPSADT
mmetsp:Transcript_8488/g.24287  ORF Transcript_8488/g.24287 Transcript_8488/m.24287 type:complete len:93 (-) Transcript_8488:29-307(-)